MMVLAGGTNTEWSILATVAAEKGGNGLLV
jgi:hypothetical protein